jgi:hypothetical protein
MSNTVTALLVLACVAFAAYDIRTKRVGVGTVRVILSVVAVAVVIVYRALT